MSDQRIPISQLSETQTAPDTSYIAIDDGSLTKKITVENFNSTSTASAQQYANQAAASAQTVEDNIATSAAQIREATLAAREATQASTSATASATSAYDSASLAQNYSVNAATSAGQAMNAADTVAQGITESKGYAEDSEAWAVGKRNGTDVPSSDITYHNNAKYYSDSASASATNAESGADRAEAAAESINLPDPTLTVGGTAADSKAAGDGIRALFDAYETATVSGETVTFNNGAGGAPLKTLTANIVPMQSGSGDPSPENVRPISGYTGVTFTRTDGENPPGVIDTYTVTFPEAAGTVYGGTLTLNEDGTGTIVVDRAAADLGRLNWTYNARGFFSGINDTIEATIKRPSSATVLAGIISSQYVEDTSSHIYYLTNDNVIGVRNSTGSIWIYDSTKGTDPVAFKASMSGVQLVYPLADPVTYVLTHDTVLTLLGANSISMSAAGTMEVTYHVDIHELIEELEDIRVKADGTVADTAGDAVREQIVELQNAVYDQDIFKQLDWEDHKTLNTDGIIRTAQSTYAAVATKKLPKGTVIEGTLYAIPTTSSSYTRVLGLGSKNISWGAPIEGTSDGSSGTPLHNAYPVDFTYTVVGDWEWVWFATAATDGDNSIRITLPDVVPADSGYNDLNWHFGYIPKAGNQIVSDTVYVYSDPIQTSGYKLVSANLVAPASVTTIAFANASTGVPTDIIRRGLDATTQREYKMCLPENAVFMLCTKITIGSSIVPVVSGLNISVTEAPEIETDVMVGVNSGYIKTDGTDGSGSAYKRTTFIILLPGQTIRFAGCVSSSGLVAATYSDNAVSAFVGPIVTGDKTYRYTEYTAGNNTEFIRISSCVGKPSTTVPWVKDEATFRALCVRYYAGNRKDPGNDRLYGKRITFMGDSLAHGNKLGPEAVWLQKLAYDHNMTAYNLGINANSVSTGGGAGSENAMVTRYNQVQESDFFVLIGGANDRRLGVPVGTVSDTTQETFCGALNIIIDGLRAMYPTMRMLFLTNYNRYSGDLAYVEAMKEVCAEKSVPCFDNFHNCGLTFMDSNLLDWIDEGLMLNSDANHHFSVAGYEWIEPIYENLLKGI